MSIGTLNEGPLHAALKSAYVANGGESEVPMQGFVADAVRSGVVYEIQTGSFSGLARKMQALAETQPVVLVHPIAQRRTIVKVDPDKHTELGRRKSPNRGAMVHIVKQLVYLPGLLNHPNFAVEVVLTEEEDVRRYDPNKRRRLGGWRTIERRLVNIVNGVRINAMEDLFNFLEDDLPEPFTTLDLATALGESRDIAGKMAYCLRHAGVTQVCGKVGNALQYERLL